MMATSRALGGGHGARANHEGGKVTCKGDVFLRKGLNLTFPQQYRNYNRIKRLCCISDS